MAQTGESGDATAEADRARARVIEEVIVTARRREESLQETPVAVSQFSGEDLIADGITTIAGIGEQVPSLEFKQSGQKSPVMYIRGVGQRSVQEKTLDPGVAMYVNGIYIARQDAALMDVIDVENIQVMRGPQGTLFGKNTIGGAILVNTREPDYDEFAMSVRASYGSHGRRDVSVNSNIPITDRIGLRLSAIDKELEGYYKNDWGEETYGDENRWAATGRLVWNVADNLSVDLFGFFSRTNELGAPRNCKVQDPTAFLTTAVIRGGFNNSYIDACNFADRSAEKGRVALNDNSFFRLDNRIVALTLTGTLGSTRLQSITAWSRQDDIRIHSEQDGTPLPVFGNGNGSTGRAKNDIIASGFDFEPEVRTQFSQEVTATLSLFSERLDWTLGAFYALEEIDDTLNAQDIGDHGLIAIDSSFLAGEPGGESDPEVIPLVAGRRLFQDWENESWATFTQASYHFTPWLEFTAGARLTTETRRVAAQALNIDFAEYANRLNAQIGSDPNIVVPIFPAAGVEPLFTPIPLAQYLAYTAPDIPYGSATEDERSARFSELTPMASLKFLSRPEWISGLGLDSLMAYVTYSEGFKAGGFDLRGEQLNRFEPERVESRELGIKLDGFNRRLRLNASVYQLQYDEIQVQLAEGGEGIIDINVFLANVGNARVSGFELETIAHVGALTIRASGDYTDTDFLDYTLPTQTRDGIREVDRSNEPFPLVPKSTRRLILGYDWSTPIGVLTPQLRYTYRDELFVGLDFFAANFDSSTLPQQEIYDFQLSWLPNDKYRISFSVNNIKDAIYNNGGFVAADAVGAANYTPAPPRHYALSFSAKIR